MKTKVIFLGNGVKFSPARNTNSKSASKKMLHSKASSTLSAKGRNGRVIEEGEKLYRTTIKSRRWFLKMMSMISNQPDTFITLTFPSSSKACNRAKLSKAYFNYFTQKMLDQFPGCYGLWKLETRPGRGFHFHMIARFRDHGQTRREAYKNLQEFWEEMFAMNFEGEEIFMAEKYAKERHEGYLVKKSKLADEMQKTYEGQKGMGHCGQKKYSLPCRGNV